MNATTDDNGSVRAVLVGIDGSPAALTAVRWAAREAVRRRAPIRMVNAFGWMPVHDADDPLQVVPKRRDGGPRRRAWPSPSLRWPRWRRTSR